MPCRVRAATKAKLRLHPSVVVARSKTPALAPGIAPVIAAPPEPHHYSQFVSHAVPLAEILCSRLHGFAGSEAAVKHVAKHDSVADGPQGQAAAADVPGAVMGPGSGATATPAIITDSLANLTTSSLGQTWSTHSLLAPGPMAAAAGAPDSGTRPGLGESSLASTRFSDGFTVNPTERRALRRAVSSRATTTADEFDPGWSIDSHSVGNTAAAALGRSPADFAATASAAARRAVWRPVTVPGRRRRDDAAAAAISAGSSDFGVVVQRHGTAADVTEQAAAAVLEAAATAGDYVQIFDDAVAALHGPGSAGDRVKRIVVPDATPEELYKIPHASVMALLQRGTKSITSPMANATSWESTGAAARHGALQFSSSLVARSAVDVFDDDNGVETFDEVGDIGPGGADSVMMARVDGSGPGVSQHTVSFSHSITLESAAAAATVTGTGTSTTERESVDSDSAVRQPRVLLSQTAPPGLRLPPAAASAWQRGTLSPTASAAGSSAQAESTEEPGVSRRRLCAIVSTPRFAVRSKWSEDSLPARATRSGKPLRPPSRTERVRTPSPTQQRTRAEQLPVKVDVSDVYAVIPPSRAPSRRMGRMLGVSDESIRKQNLYGKKATRSSNVR
jgi:hypothetical protein